MRRATVLTAIATLAPSLGHLHGLPLLTSSAAGDEEETPAETESESVAEDTEFLRGTRTFDRESVPEVFVPIPERYGLFEWGDPQDPPRHPPEIERAHGDALRERSDGFGESVAVFPAGMRADGSRMPPTCAMGLPNDGSGSVWFLTPEGLEEECLDASILSRPVGGSKEHPPRGFGAAVEVGPDLDGDGNRELLTTAIAANEDGDPIGLVVVFSVARRELLAEWTVPGVGSAFGVAACRVPDVDRDGSEDVAVLTGPPDPMVHVISSRSGGTLRRIHLPSRVVMDWWRPHYRIRPLPESGDGGPLVLVSVPSVSPGELTVLDLATGRERWSSGCPDAPTDDDHWCRYSSVVATQDLDGDGVSELLVAGFEDYRSSAAYAAYSVVSGATGEDLRVTGSIYYLVGGDGDAFVTDYADLDGDGFREHLVGAAGNFSRDFVLFDGRTGDELLTIDLGQLLNDYSNDVQAHVDWDGGGMPDLVIHDTDVWAYGFEGQWMVMSMEEKEILHYVRPGDVERLILEREGW